MVRMDPRVRALCERARRPATMFLVGMGLLLPGGMLSTRFNQATTVTEKVAAARKGTAPLVALWEQNALARVEQERTAEHSARTYAAQFGISEQLAGKIYREAVRAEIAPKVAFGLIRAESSFRRTVVSPVGAVGYTQLMPSTARWLAPGTSRSDLFDEDVNLRVGFKYLRQLMDKYDGNVGLALTAYNRGPGTVDNALKRGRNPDNGYAEMILEGKNSHQTGHAKRWLRRS